jgi:iron-sulfur cluster repair protein YtfE (RIC family)
MTMVTATTLVTQPLRDEHQELLPFIEQMKTVADAIGTAPAEIVRAQASATYDFLAHHLVPHARAEDAVLYPMVDRLMGAPGATATMSREHRVVGQLAGELRALTTGKTGEPLAAADAAALRRILYGLYTLVKTHLDNEEEVYLPLLDAKLTTAQATDLFEGMEAAASPGRSTE